MIGNAIAYDLTYSFGVLAISLYMFVFTKDEEIKACCEEQGGIVGQSKILQIIYKNGKNDNTK